MSLAQRNVFMNQEQKNKFEQQLLDKKIWFCPLPFTHVFSSLSGRYAPCYDSHQRYLNSEGNQIRGIGHYVDNTSIVNWYTSDFMNKLRSEMLKEDYDEKYLRIQCEGCWKQEDKYGRSDRLKYTEQILSGKFDGKVPELLRVVEQFRSTGAIELGERVLDIKMKIFGNACNLDCYMCTPRSANTRIISLKKLNRVYDPDLDPYDAERVNTQKFDDEKYLDDIASVAQYIKSIKIIGGEPLVMKNHYKLLEKLVQTGHSKEIILVYKTNLSVFNMDGYNFQDYFEHFREFVMKISIDTYGKYNDYIRKKSDWDYLINNMMIMKARKNARVNVHSVISMISVLSFDQLQQYLKDQEIDHTYYILEHPEILHVQHLPREIKDKLIPVYKDYPNIQRALEKDWDIEKFVAAIDYCIELDGAHEHSLFDLHPELKSHYQEAKKILSKEQVE
jgi:sulfatase maturation enzyme AslB (radical SAM superfamily)